MELGCSMGIWALWFHESIPFRLLLGYVGLYDWGITALLLFLPRPKRMEVDDNVQAYCHQEISRTHTRYGDRWQTL